MQTESADSVNRDDYIQFHKNNTICCYYFKHTYFSIYADESKVIVNPLKTVLLLFEMLQWIPIYIDDTQI